MLSTVDRKQLRWSVLVFVAAGHVLLLALLRSTAVRAPRLPRAQAPLMLSLLRAAPAHAAAIEAAATREPQASPRRPPARAPKPPADAALSVPATALIPAEAGAAPALVGHSASAPALVGRSASAPAPRPAARAASAPLRLSLPRAASGPARAPWFEDERSNSRPLTLESRLRRALGDDHVTEQRMNDGRKRFHERGECVEVQPSASAGLDPFNQAVRPSPKLVGSC